MLGLRAGGLTFDLAQIGARRQVGGLLEIGIIFCRSPFYVSILRPVLSQDDVPIPSKRQLEQNLLMSSGPEIRFSGTS